MRFRKRRIEGTSRCRCGICDCKSSSNIEGRIEEELKRAKMSRGSGSKWLFACYCLLLYVIMIIVCPQVTANSPSTSIFREEETQLQNPHHHHQKQQQQHQYQYQHQNQKEVEQTRRLSEGDEAEAEVAAATKEVKINRNRNRNRNRKRRSAFALKPINELRISGSKSEPPSRPSVDWSKQRPYFGPDMARNVSVELGKTAYLTCKVYELGDKTVSWLRPRENEILTVGRFTYIGDSRFASINDNGSHDWILEIKDVGLNDSTSYECQVSTDPKMSAIINLQVKAAKAKIKQGEQYYAPTGSNIEFTCEISQRSSTLTQTPSSPSNGLQQTYWYFNGNLLNYRSNSIEKNFSIEWDSMTQTSRFRLFNVQSSDAGNYSCKPTSAEPTTIRLHVKRTNQKSGTKERTHSSNGFHSANTKEAQKTRQHSSILESVGFGLDSPNSHATSPSPVSHIWVQLTMLTTSCLFALLLTT